MRKVAIAYFDEEEVALKRPYVGSRAVERGEERKCNQRRNKVDKAAVRYSPPTRSRRGETFMLCFTLLLIGKVGQLMQ